MKPPKIAIVYDWIDKWGGVERLLLALHELFPSAVFYTSHFDLNQAYWAKELSIKTSFMQNLPRFIRERRMLALPFYPFAFESLDLSEYRLIISVSSSFAKSVITRPETIHINICLTTTRFLWLYPGLYLTAGVKQAVQKTYSSYLKKWDMIAAQRSDHIISISKTVQNRVKKIYKHDSEIIYPPFDIEYWTKIKSEIRSASWRTKFNPPAGGRNSKFFLVVSRLEPYKRIDLVIKTFRQLKNHALVIVGKGSQLRKLRQEASVNIQFLQDLNDDELATLYSNSQALIMPQEEDFGYVSLEAQFFGCPIIAYKKGGATETVIEGKTGIFFEEQIMDSLRQALIKYDKMKINLKGKALVNGPKNAERFSKEIFKKKFLELIVRKK